jgi:hypothetical protein
MSDLTAEQRGRQMMEAKLKDLPPLAVEFCQHLCHESGGCMETFLTAWTVYAQCVEGLECSDDLYHARPQDIAWFRERQVEQ